MPKIAGRRLATSDRHVVYPKNKKDVVTDVVGEGSKAGGDDGGLKMQKMAAAGAWVAAMKRRTVPTPSPVPLDADADADAMDVDQPEPSSHHHHPPMSLSTFIENPPPPPPFAYPTQLPLEPPPPATGLDVPWRLQYATPPTAPQSDPPHSHFPIEHAIAKQRTPSPAVRAANGVTATVSRDGSQSSASGSTRPTPEPQQPTQQTVEALAALAAELVKIIQKVYHLSEEPERIPPVRTEIALRPEVNCQFISESSTGAGHAQPPPPAQPQHAAAAAVASRPVEAKAALVTSWLEDVAAAKQNATPDPVPSWAVKAFRPTRSSGSDSPYTDTLVGEFEQIPTKLPADDNPEDEVDRVSLTAELPMRVWVAELLRRTDVAPNQLKVAACYLIALNPHVQLIIKQRREAAMAVQNNEIITDFSVSPLSCPRRTVVAALILASKFLGEKVYSMRAWARVTGLETPDLVQSEMAIGSALNWRLWVGGEVRTLRSDVYQRRILELLKSEDGPRMVKFVPRFEEQVQPVSQPVVYVPPPVIPKLEPREDPLVLSSSSPNTVDSEENLPITPSNQNIAGSSIVIDGDDDHYTIKGRNNGKGPVEAVPAPAFAFPPRYHPAAPSNNSNHHHHAMPQAFDIGRLAEVNGRCVPVIKQESVDEPRPLGEAY